MILALLILLTALCVTGIVLDTPQFRDDREFKQVHDVLTDVTLICMSQAPLEKLAAYKERRGWTVPWVSAYGSDFLFDYGYAFRREDMSGVVREEFDMGQLLREAPQWLRDYREEVGAPDLESAVSVSAGWSVFAMRDGAAYNTYRVYPHSRLITPLFSALLELLPKKD